MNTPSPELALSVVRKVRGRPALSAGEFVERFWEKVDRSAGPDDCWPWTAAKLANGYGSVWFKGHPQKAHRIAWRLTYGPIPAGALICHNCDNRLCCNPGHLYAGSHWDNTQDMLTRSRGNRDGRAHLRAELIPGIRERYAAGGVTLAALAAEYGVTDVCIHLVVTRKTWRHVA